MAAPLVSGVAAGYLSSFPMADAAAVRAALKLWASKGQLNTAAAAAGTPNEVLFSPACGWANYPCAATLPSFMSEMNSSAPLPSAAAPDESRLMSVTASASRTAVEGGEPFPLGVVWSGSDGLKTGESSIKLFLLFSASSIMLHAILIL